ncbi:MAG: SDR family oxidoreductase [Alphaproteobacteria bacterium]|nr:SDR family oxidoreductase [Alphaproteobacteria bacterium]
MSEVSETKRKDGAGRVALVSGASSGIGKAFAHILACNGFDLVLTARREQQLRALAQDLEATFATKTHVMRADLTDPTAPRRLFDDIAAADLHVDVLVNNAGYGMPGFFNDTAWDSHRDYLQVMAIAPVHLAYLAAPAMVERGYGRIVNVGSVSGLLPPHAGGTLYYPVKSFLIKFSLAHGEELRRAGVHVTALCPGFTRTNFQQASGGSVEAVTMPGFMWMDADVVAAKGYRAVMRGDPVCVPGWANRALVGLFKYLPEGIGRWIIRATGKPTD